MGSSLYRIGSLLSSLALVLLLICAQFSARGEAAISFVSAASANNGNGEESLTISRPDSATAVNLLIATVTARTSVSITAPSGWTEIANTENGDIRQASYYKIAGASEPASYSWTLSDKRKASGGIIQYSGADESAPIDQSQAASGASGNAAAAAVTTTYINSMVVVAASFARDATVTPAEGTTERYENRSTSGNANSRTTNEAADFIQATAGSTGSKTVVPSDTSANWITHTVALNEDPALSASFPPDYNWGSLTVAATNTSAEQALSVTSNRSWGVKISSDEASGRMREWNGSSYVNGGTQLSAPMQWSRTTPGPATSYIDLNSTQAVVTSNQAASSSPISVGVTYRQVVDFSDDPISGSNTYRIVITYDSAQGF